MLDRFRAIWWLAYCFLWSGTLIVNPLGILVLSSESGCGIAQHSRISLTVLPGITRKKFRFHEILKTARERSTNAEPEQRLIEMRWFNIEQNSTIALYGHPPQDNVTNILDQVSAFNQSSGYYITNITLPRVRCDNLSSLNNNCMYFWIAVLDAEMNITEINCFRGFPFWMYEAREHLRNVEIRRAFIPGTHNSGTYDYYDSGTFHARVTQYVECQDESVFNQLFYGARYIELRASFSPKRRRERPANIVCLENYDNNYDISSSGSSKSNETSNREKRDPDCRTATLWSVHGSFVTTSSFDQIARDIRRFLEATKEIVLIDLHKFKISGKWWWTSDLHLELWRLLYSELGEFMAPYKEDVTFGELWKSNKRLIVSTIYPMQHGNPCIWPSFSHIWANTDRLQHLEVFLDNRLCAEVQKSKRITVAKGQLTPRLGLKMLRNTLRNRGGVRSFTPDTNRVMDRLYRDKWACANVVAVDYLLSSDVVRVAIAVNTMPDSPANSTRPLPNLYFNHSYK